MANPAVATLIFVAGVANGVCLAQAPAAAGALVLNGGKVAAGIATFDAARRVAFASTGNEGATIFSITGTNRYGNVISETLTIPNGTIALTQLDYLTVTAVSMNAAAVGNITVGTSSATTIGSSEWVPINIHMMPVQMEFFLTVASANPSTCTLEFTPDDPNVATPPGGTAQVTGSGRPSAATPYPGSGSIESASFNPPQPWPDITIVATNLQTRSIYNGVGQCWRLTINSGTTAATIQGIQAGIRN